MTSNRAKPGRKPIYPFAELEVGQHFDAPRDMGRTERGDRRQGTIIDSARGWRKYNGKPDHRFTIRLIDEHTVRCTRIA